MAYIVKLRALGRAWVAGIPKSYCRELSWAPGTYLHIQRHNTGALIITDLETTIDHKGRRRSRNPARPHRPA